MDLKKQFSTNGFTKKYHKQIWQQNLLEMDVYTSQCENYHLWSQKYLLNIYFAIKTDIRGSEISSVTFIY